MKGISVRKCRPRAILALFPVTSNREWSDHLPSKRAIHTYVMMINESNPQNGINAAQTYGEAISPGKATGRRQLATGCRQITARTKVRTKWSQEDYRQASRGMLKVDAGNECYKYRLRRECSRKLNRAF